jgi:hypothetical protein
MKPDTLPLAHTLVPGAVFLLFVVEFVQQDLAHVRQGDWINIKEDFEAYLRRTSFLGQPAIILRRLL